MMKISITLFAVSLLCMTSLCALKSPGVSVQSKNKDGCKVAYVGAGHQETEHITKADVKK
ncbi:MAG: hypothetical protein K940chlam3_01138 [Chlamydiae bacterium]|nr:hypothetical protein [Chlamydiota bacterium]